MDPKAIKSKRQEIIDRDGPWTAHNIRLHDDIYTMSKDVPGGGGLVRFTQVIADAAGGNLASLRCLDLACLEGQYGIELAQQGAEVVGIEGRTINLIKANFAKDVLALGNVEFVQDDVRNLSAERYGYFDVVLCSGILYHLNAPDVFAFLEKVAEVCTRFALIDSHVSLTPERPFHYKNREYWGSEFTEYEHPPSPEEEERTVWAAMGNTKSAWLTRPSLYNALSDFGFTSVHECHNPPQLGKTPDRVTLLAFKNRRVNIHSTPLMNDSPVERWPEQHSSQNRAGSPKRRVEARGLLHRSLATLRRIVKGSE